MTIDKIFALANGILNLIEDELSFKGFDVTRETSQGSALLGWNENIVAVQTPKGPLTIGVADTEDKVIIDVCDEDHRTLATIDADKLRIDELVATIENWS